MIDVKKFLDKKCDIRDIFFQQVAGINVFFTLSGIKHRTSGEMKGAGFRNVTGDFTELVSCELNQSLLERLAARNLEIKLRAPSLNTDQREIDSLLKTLDGELRDKGGAEVKNIDMSFSLSDSSFGVFDGEKIVYFNRYRQRFAVTIIVERAGARETGFASVVATEVPGKEFFTSAREKAFGALELAVKLLDAAPAPAGEMPVLISRKAGGTLIHEAIGHSLEADAVRQGISPSYQGMIGQKVASPEVTVIDDPLLKGKNGSYEIDDEGIPARKTVLIEKGVLRGYLLDRKEAGFAQVSSNGHGRRDSFKVKPIPRMGITYLAPGSSDFNGMIKTVNRGLLVRKMGGGQVNPANGDFVFEVREGYLIENGKAGPLVKRATLAGNGPGLLKNIKYIGAKTGWDNGTCGKDGQAAPVSDGMPDTLLPGVVVGGG